MHEVEDTDLAALIAACEEIVALADQITGYPPDVPEPG